LGRGLALWRSVSSPRPSNGACDPPADGSPTSFTGGFRPEPAMAGLAGGDDGTVEVDQAERIASPVAVGGSPSPAALVLLREEQGETHLRVLPLCKAWTELPYRKKPTEPHRELLISCTTCSPAQQAARASS